MPRQFEYIKIILKNVHHVPHFWLHVIVPTLYSNATSSLLCEIGDCKCTIWQRAHRSNYVFVWYVQIILMYLLTYSRLVGLHSHRMHGTSRQCIGFGNIPPLDPIPSLGDKAHWRWRIFIKWIQNSTTTHNNRFTALWNLSGKTRVSRYQKNIHPLLSS